MTTIALGSAKGGTGKTITALSFAECLAYLDRRVLLIDADAATTGLTLFLSKWIVPQPGRERRRGLFESAGAMPDVFGLAERQSVIPASYRERLTVGGHVKEIRTSLESSLTFAESEFDYVLIDCQAGSDMYAQAAVELSDAVVLFSEYDSVSIQGVKRLQGLLPTLLNEERTWIAFSKVLPEFAERVGDALELVRYLPPIPWDADVVRGMVSRRVPVDMDRGSIHTSAVLRTLAVLFREDIDHDIRAWREDARMRFLAPQTAQFDAQRSNVSELEREYETAQEDYERLTRSDKRGRNVGAIIAATMVVVIATLLTSEVIDTSTASLLLLGALGSVAGSWLIGILQKRGADQEELPELRRRMDALRFNIDDAAGKLSQLQTLANMEVRKFDDI